MESVESIAAKIAHEDLVYLDYSPPVYQQVDRMALERAIAAALRAERAKLDVFGVRFDGTGPSCTKVQDFLGGNLAEGTTVTWKNCTYHGGVLQTYKGPREFVPGSFIVQLSTGGLAVLSESVSTQSGPTIKRHEPVVDHDRDEHGANYFAEMVESPAGEWVRFSDMQVVLDELRAKLEKFAVENERLRNALAAVCRRMEINELVNKPKDPCNHYDQPAYDEAMDALKCAKRNVAGDGIPVSGDGVYLTPGATVWPRADVQIEGEEGGTVVWAVRDNNSGDLIEHGEWEAKHCYSTQAAEAAKEKTQ